MIPDPAGPPTPALAAAIAIAALIDLCPACAEPANSGLCHSERCRRQVLPQMKQSALARDTHSGKHAAPTTPLGAAAVIPPLNTPGRGAARHALRFARALAGESVPVRHRRAA